VKSSVKVAGGVGAAVLALAAYFAPSPSGVELVKHHEGVRTQAYLDVAAVPTICYGSTRGVHLGQVATLAQCEQRLKTDLTFAGEAVQKHTQRFITQGQYDALVSFVFNFGETKFRNSTLLRKLNAGDCYGAAREFDRWVYAGKPPKVYRGLVKRRADERRLFEAGCAAWR